MNLSRIFRSFLLLIAFMVTAFQVQASPSVEALAKGGAGGWLNVDKPLTLEDFSGRLVLLDFWTYGCINCMQVIPDLEALEEKFGDKLLIIGVHSAKFENEKSGGRIIQAARRFNLKHPVINDSDFAIWNDYNVKAWPTLVLLGTDGQEISRYTGEGNRENLDRDISNAITTVDAKKLKPLPRIMADERKDYELWFPARIALSGEQIFIANSGFNKITITDKTGKVKTTIGSGEEGFTDGNYDKASFNQPRGIALIGSKLYVADTGNHALRVVDLTAKKVTTIAGNGKRGHMYDVKDTPAKDVELASPWDIDVLKDGKTLAIAMAGQHQLWTYDTEAKTFSVFAGSGYEKIEDGAADKAALAQPSGISVSVDTVYFVDAESSALRMVKNGEVKTLIGTGLFDFGFEDGAYPDAKLQHPQGLFASKDKIYIADTYNGVIRIYDPATELLSTLQTTGQVFSEPGDIVVSGPSAYIADTSNHRIKKVDLRTGEASELNVRK